MSKKKRAYSVDEKWTSYGRGYGRLEIGICNCGTNVILTPCQYENAYSIELPEKKKPCGNCVQLVEQEKKIAKHNSGASSW